MHHHKQSNAIEFNDALKNSKEIIDVMRWLYVWTTTTKAAMELMSFI